MNGKNNLIHDKYIYGSSIERRFNIRRREHGYVMESRTGGQELAIYVTDSDGERIPDKITRNITDDTIFVGLAKFKHSSPPDNDGWI